MKPKLRKHAISIFITLTLILFGLLATTQHAMRYFPVAEFNNNPHSTTTAQAPATPPQSGGNPEPGSLDQKLNFTFLFDPLITSQSCEALTVVLVRNVLSHCPQCELHRLACLSQLEPNQAMALRDFPLEVPSLRIPHGTVLFFSENQELARRACLSSQSISVRNRTPFPCVLPGQPRPILSNSVPIDRRQIWITLILTSLCFLSSWLICWWIVRYEHLHAHLSMDHSHAGPQKMHLNPTPRIGGVGLMGGLLSAVLCMNLISDNFLQREFGLLLLCGIPAFLGGIMEDITKRVGILERLLLTMLSATMAGWLLNGVLRQVHLPGLDNLLMTHLTIALLFTIFAVGGIANAVNIIDGFNGLSGTYALIVALALAFVASQVGDLLVFSMALTLGGCLLGFLFWNWPRGKLFLGDGGAYLTGFLLAEMGVLLATRNLEVSPWFPVAIMIYPLFETLFSIYRRVLVRRQSPGQPDALHLHTLIYRRVVARRSSSGEILSKMERNNRVTPYIVIPTAILSLLSCGFWSKTPVLMLMVLGFCVFYVVRYRNIVKWSRGTRNPRVLHPPA